MVVASAVAAHHDARVVGRCRGHAEHLARLRFEGHDGTELAREEAFGQCLEVLVEAQGEVLARHGLRVVASVLVVPLGAPVDVAEHDAHALHPAELLFVRTFHAEFADKVAALVVVVRVFLQFALADFRHVAEDVRAE